MDGRRHSWITSIATAVAWRRRLLAAGLAAAAAALAMHALQPSGPPTVPLVVAARDLPGGTTLTPSDLRVAVTPRDVVPDGVVPAVDAAAGRLLAGPARAGEPITDVRLLGPSLLAGWGDDLVAVPVRVADPGAAAMLRAGDRIDLLAAAPDGVVGASTVAPDVPVISVPPPGDAGVLADGALVVVAVPEDAASTLAQAAAVSRLSVALRR